MTLDEYLRIEGNSAAKLAEAANTSGATITRLLYGEQNASSELVKAIVEATGGAVTAEAIIFGPHRVKAERAA